MKSCQVAAVHRATIRMADTVGSICPCMLNCCNDYREATVCATLRDVTVMILLRRLQFFSVFYTGVQIGHSLEGANTG